MLAYSAETQVCHRSYIIAASFIWTTKLDLVDDFHMLWDTTANTAVNVKKPQTSNVIGFSVHK